MSVIAATGTNLFRGDISGILNEFATNNNQFVAAELLPFLNVSSREDYFLRMKRATITGLQETRVSTTGTANRVTYNIDRDTYSCVVHKLEATVPDDKSAEYGALFSLESALGLNLLMDLMRAMEKRAADLLLNATTFPASGDTGLNVATTWETSATSTPVDDIIAGKEAIKKRTGLTENFVLEVHDYVADKLCMNKQIRETLGLRYAPGAMEVAQVNDVVLAGALGVSKVVRGKARYNSAPENATVVMTDIWARQQAFLCIASSGDPVGQPHIGRIVAWNEFGGPVTADSYRDETVESSVIRVKQAVIEKLFIPECGFRFTNIAA